MNAATFAVRVPWFLRQLGRLKRAGVGAWWLNLSGIEFDLAALVALRAMGEHPRSWLHNPERFAFYRNAANQEPRTIDRFRDALADRYLFRFHPVLLTPSQSSSDVIRTRASDLRHRRLGILYPTIPEQSASTSDTAEPADISLWMIGRIEFGPKNNLAVAEAAHEPGSRR